MGDNPNLPSAVVFRIDPRAVERDIGPAAKAAFFAKHPSPEYDRARVETTWNSYEDEYRQQYELGERQHKKNEAIYARQAEEKAASQEFARNLPKRPPPPPPAPIDVDWYRDAWHAGATYHRMNAAINEPFHIRSKLVTTGTGEGVYLIQSKNIFLQVPVLNMADHVAGGPAYLNGWTDEQGRKEPTARHGIWHWRTKKGDDDEFAYGKTIDGMYRKSAGNGYFLSEQHAVWAMGASARTGCRIPPEFFAEIEVNGGTAGNGPDVLPAGNIGEPMSTIAMAHDADWLIGRLFHEGPLGGLGRFGATRGVKHLFLSRSSLKAMGSAGLFYAKTIGLLAPGDDSTDEERTMRRDIDAFLDNPHVEHRYRAWNSIFLNQDATLWRVKFRRGYSKFQTSDAVKVFVAGVLTWAGLPLTAAMTDVMIGKAIEEYIFDEKDPRVGEANDVRDSNLHNRKTPFFPKHSDGGPSCP